MCCDCASVFAVVVLALSARKCISCYECPGCGEIFTKPSLCKSHFRKPCASAESLQDEDDEELVRIFFKKKWDSSFVRWIHTMGWITRHMVIVWDIFRYGV